MSEVVLVFACLFFFCAKDRYKLKLVRFFNTKI